VFDPREGRRDSGAVARILLSDATCAKCIMSNTGLDLNRLLGAIGGLEPHLRLIWKQGRCRSCLKTDGAILTVDVSSRSRLGSAGSGRP
jgi:hypothetical protein